MTPPDPPDPVVATADPTADPAERPGRGRRFSGWRLGPPVVVAVCGVLFVVSATNSGGTDLRPGRYTSLSSLVQREAADYGALERQAADLDAEVTSLGRQVRDSRVTQERRRAARLAADAGLGPRTGPGVTVVLADSPREVLEEALAADREIFPLVVHQQDIQAVVNALWVGGAEAVTIQGQRVITTTGIKCEGNAVQLQGVPYPQPYVISGVGDPYALAEALDDDIDVTRFRADADSPEVSVGWDLELEDEVEAPAYAGVVDVVEASPQRSAG